MTAFFALEKLLSDFLDSFGRGILRSSQPLATLKQHQRYALWGIRLCPTSYRLRGLASRGGGLYTFLPLPHYRKGKQVGDHLKERSGAADVAPHVLGGPGDGERDARTY